MESIHGKYRKQYEKVIENIQDYMGGEIRISAGGSPYLVLGSRSVIYFGRTAVFRVFTNFGSKDNKKLIDLHTWEDVVSFLHYNMGIPWKGEKQLEERPIVDAKESKRWQLIDLGN